MSELLFTHRETAGLRNAFFQLCNSLALSADFSTEVQLSLDLQHLPGTLYLG